MASNMIILTKEQKNPQQQKTKPNLLRGRLHCTIMRGAIFIVIIVQFFLTILSRIITFFSTISCMTFPPSKLAEDQCQ